MSKHRQTVKYRNGDAIRMMPVSCFAAWMCCKLIITSWRETHPAHKGRTEALAGAANTRVVFDL
jgi:hypothetical protein